jgi:hypothetical protein
MTAMVFESEERRQADMPVQSRTGGPSVDTFDVGE